MGFMRPCFNFAQLTVGKFKTRANKHSHIECMYMYNLYCNRANSKLVETEVLHGGRKKGRENILHLTVFTQSLFVKLSHQLKCWYKVGNSSKIPASPDYRFL